MSAEATTSGHALSPRDVVARLQAAYPKVFTTPPRPLQIGIHRLICANKPPALEQVSSAALYKGIRKWVETEAYLQALCDQTPRIGLDGQPVEDVSDEAAKSATRRVLKLRRKRKAWLLRIKQRKAEARAKAQAKAQAEADPVKAV